MALLHGLAAPSGEGTVVEVHLDIMEAPAAFLDRLVDLGFESDPFLDFFPPGYHFHSTGRMRVLPEKLRGELPGIGALIARVVEEARQSNVRMYAECELVRRIDHFSEATAPRSLSALEPIAFKSSSAANGAAADIHVEFRSGTVSPEVRRALLDRRFYWVRTPASDRFPSEDIATVQTSVFQHAQAVYERLVASPLPACTGIHLEQKLAMIRSYPDVPMPEVMELIADRS